VNSRNRKPSRLDDVAELISMGLKRARLRIAARENRKNLTGLCDGLGRVLVPESGQ
jgi:hypothetical protein